MTTITEDLITQLESLERPLKSIAMKLILELGSSTPASEYTFDTSIFFQSTDVLVSRSSRLKLCGLFNNLGASQFILPKSDGTIKFLSLFKSWRFSENIETLYISFNEELYPHLLEIKNLKSDSAIYNR